MTSSSSPCSCSVDVLHHGVSVNSSSSKVIARVPSSSPSSASADQIVYASHLLLNIAAPKTVGLLSQSSEQHQKERIWNVTKTLRTRTSVEAEDTSTAAANVSTLTAKRVITSVVSLEQHKGSATIISNSVDVDDVVVLVCGFSDGTLTSWIRRPPPGDSARDDEEWEECILLGSLSSNKATNTNNDCVEADYSADVEKAAIAAMKGRSITDVDGYFSFLGPEHNIGRRNDDSDDNSTSSLCLSVCVCSSGGTQFFQFLINLGAPKSKISNRTDCDTTVTNTNAAATIQQTKKLIHAPSNVVRYRSFFNSIFGTGLYLVGTAAPRSNKIHVFTTVMTAPLAGDERTDTTNDPIYRGSLTGHEDWITCFDWISTTTMATATSISMSSNLRSTYYLASGSQDAKIRLWKWVTTTIDATNASIAAASDDINGEKEPDGDGDDDVDNDDDELIEDGEARLEIVQQHHGKTATKTSVYLEALLIGHEEIVTSVAWHPNPSSWTRTHGDQRKSEEDDLLLVSSSMDRSILVWSCSSGVGGVLDGNSNGNKIDGVWSPIQRIGSPCGILGGVHN